MTPPASGANNIWNFPKAKQQANEVDLRDINIFKYMVFFRLTTAGMDHVQSKLLCGILDLNQKQEMLEESAYLRILPLSHSFWNVAKLNGFSVLLRGSRFSPALRRDEESGRSQSIRRTHLSGTLPSTGRHTWHVLTHLMFLTGPQRGPVNPHFREDEGEAQGA